MKSKKIIALGLVAAMTIAMVTGCGGRNLKVVTKQLHLRVKQMKW